MRIERGAACVALFALAILVLRDAAVRSRLPDNPHEAVLAWPGHPAAIIADGMARIGEAAIAGHPVGDALTGPIIQEARLAPLATEPFLVAGVKQQTLGNEALAGELFLAAERRDPRSVASHLFLSAHYSKIGKTEVSLSELGRLIHVVPNTAGQVAPRIAASVQKIGGPRVIQALVAQSPELRDDIMTALSTDARNLNIVLSLRTQASSNAWQPFMVQSLVGAGNYKSALALWASINRVSSNAAFRPLIFDPGFRHKLAPPFGWALADQSVTSGVAEPLERGGLHVISYGRDPFTVASQTLLLSPGNYVLSQVASSASGDISSLSWQVSCLGSERKLGQLTLSRGRASGQFTVPNNCPAQRIDLLAKLGDLPETLDAKLDPVALRHGG